MPARRGNRRDLTAALEALEHQHVELSEQQREIQRLREENQILRKAAEPLIHHAPARERFAFIHRLRDQFGVRRLRRILVTDHSNYHARVRASVRRVKHTINDEELLARIVEVHTAHPAYGAERVTRELKRHDVGVGRRAARLMREHGIAGITRRKRRNLTKPDAGAAVVPDLIQREFTAPMPGLKLVGDISCFANGNAIMHTDRGSQYHSKAYRNTLKRLEIRQSTSRTGSRLDGAAAESFLATIKTEIGTDIWPDRASAHRDIENWITYYNQRRLHSAPDYQTPSTARRAWQDRTSMAS